VATGGQAAETLENALVRGPQELHSLQRAVTAQDFGAGGAVDSRAVARAKALTRAALWTFATPGTVEVLLVPDLPAELRSSSGPVSAAALQEPRVARGARANSTGPRRTPPIGHDVPRQLGALQNRALARAHRRAP
jgi:hypothetical protein